MSGTSWGHALMTTHAICQAAQAHEPCTVCHAAAGCPCTADRPGVHACRVCKAESDRHITRADLASVLWDRVIGGWTLIPDPEVTS